MINGMFEVFRRDSFWPTVWQHIELSAISLLVGIVIAVSLAVVVSRSSRASLVAINITNLGRGIPDLAWLALFLVLVGIGQLPAIMALILLAIPPILINTITALNQVDARVIDSAKGMGFSGVQILKDVQLPIAAPVIFAGIRTSAVQVVAGATLATFIGGGGLGNFIVEGFQGGDNATMLAGAIPVTILAIITEFAFGGLESLSTPKGLKIAASKN